MVCMLEMSKEIKYNCTDYETLMLEVLKVHHMILNTFNGMHVGGVEAIPVNLLILGMNLMKYTCWNWHFISNLVQFKCLWKGEAQLKFKFLWKGLGRSCHTCRRLWLTCRSARVLGGGEVSWSFLHKGWSSYWSNRCINGFKFHVIHV